MSEVTIFIIGAIIFAITIAGAVIAGGMSMHTIEAVQNPKIFPPESSPPPTEAV
jgi:hypothetical protein